MKQSPDETYENQEPSRPEPDLQIEAQPEVGGQTPSTAPDNSWSTGVGEAATGFDSPPGGSSSRSQPMEEWPQPVRPSYPPGTVPEDESEPEGGPTPP
jgi:hypothetical protein